MSSSTNYSTTLAIKKEILGSDLPWIVFNEHGDTVARFRDDDDARSFLYYGKGGSGAAEQAKEEESCTEAIKRLEAEVAEDEIADLKRIAEGFGITFDGDEYSNDELLRLGIGCEIPGPLSDEQVRQEANAILSEPEEA